METITIFTNTVLGFIGGFSFAFIIFVIIGIFASKKYNSFNLNKNDSKPSD